MTERTIKIKGLISGQVDIGTFGLVELELLEGEKEQQALEEKLLIHDLSKRLKDYVNWVGKNEFTMFADENWRDGFGNEFTNDELYNMYLKSKN